MEHRPPGDYACYLVSHEGVYLGAYSIVWATSEEHAREEVLRLIRDNRLGEIIWSITEIPLGEDRLIWNGDY